MNRLKNLEEEFAEEYILLRKSVTCSICLDVYQNPVCLPCQHGFCESCITMALKIREKCPICLAPAKKNRLKTVANIDETLDLFRRLLSTIEQSLKAKKQAAAIQKMIINSEPSEKRSSNDISDELDVTQHSSDCNSDSESVAIKESVESVKDHIPSEFMQDVAMSPSVLFDELQTADENKKRNFSSSGINTKTTPSSNSKRGRKDAKDSSLSRKADKFDNITQPSSLVDKNDKNEESKPNALQVDPNPDPTSSLTMSSFLRTFQIFHKGELVSVLPRTWSGINKLGGVGKVEHVRAVDTNENVVDISNYFTTNQDQTLSVSTTLSSKELEFLASLRLYYRVKFVLDGRVDDDIPAAFVEKFEELSRERRRHGTPSNSLQKNSIGSPNGKNSRKGLNCQSPAVSNIIPFTSSSVSAAAPLSVPSSTKQLKRQPKASDNTAVDIGNTDSYWSNDNGSNTNNPITSTDITAPMVGKENEVPGLRSADINNKLAASNSSNSGGKKKKKVLSAISNTNSNVNIANSDDKNNQESSTMLSLSKSSLKTADSSSSSITGHKRKRINFVLLTTCIDEDKQTIASFNKQFLAKSNDTNKIAFTSFDEIFQYFLALHPDEVSSASHFTTAVTHVVVSVGQNDSSSSSASSSSFVMKTRTMKYMQALAHGLWVVSTQWIYDSILASLTNNRDEKTMLLLPEDAYEVKNNVKALIPRAPMRARQAKLNKKIPGLFAGYVVVLFGLFPMPGPARSDLEDLLVHTGVTRCFTQMHSFWEYYRTLRRESFDQFHQGAAQKEGSKSHSNDDYPTIVIVRSKDVIFTSKEEAIATDVECILDGDVSGSMMHTYELLCDPSSSNKNSTGGKLKPDKPEEAVLNLEDDENDDSNSANNLKRLEQERLLKYFSTFPQVTALWVMDTITNFQMQPFVQYAYQNQAVGNSKQPLVTKKNNQLATTSNLDKKVKRGIR